MTEVCERVDAGYSQGCEKRCVFFKALPTEDQSKNIKAIQIAATGDEFPGLFNTMCGGCVKFTMAQAAINEATIKFGHVVI